MPWLDDLVTLMHDAEVAEFGTNLFVSTKAAPPLLASGTLSIVETSGGAPENTHTRREGEQVLAVVRPAYLRVAAQIMARADTYAAARELAQNAFDAVVGIRNCWIIAEEEYTGLSEGLQSGWYREINALQAPFDAGVDDRKQARCGFNIMGIRRP